MEVGWGELMASGIGIELHLSLLWTHSLPWLLIGWGLCLIWRMICKFGSVVVFFIEIKPNCVRAKNFNKKEFKMQMKMKPFLGSNPKA